MRRYKVTVTTAADGTAVAFSPRLSGKVPQIEYVKDGTTLVAGLRVGLLADHHERRRRQDCESGAHQTPRRWWSTARQRSCTTGMPAASS